MRARSIAWAACFGAAVSMGALGCGDSTGPSNRGPLAGRWHSDPSLFTFAATLDVILTQNDSIVEGDGIMVAVPGPRRMLVIGFESSSPGNATPFILTFSGVNTLPAVLFGQLSANGDTLSGEYRWFNLPPDTIKLVRQ